MAIDQPERAADGRAPTGQLRERPDDVAEASAAAFATGLELRTASQHLREHSRVLREFARELRARNPNGSR